MGLYQTCTTSTMYSDHVLNAAKGVCAGVYFAELSMALAALFNAVAFVVYLVTNSSTKVRSRECVRRLNAIYECIDRLNMHSSFHT